MDMKRALWMGAAVFVVSYVVAMLAAFALGAAPGQPNAAVGLVAVVVTIAVLVFFTLRYFRSVSAGAKEGLFFGIVAGVVGIIIDTTIAVLSDPSKPAGNLANPAFWGAVAMIVVVPALVGAFKGRKAAVRME